MNFWERKKLKWVLEYIETLKPKDKSKSERLPFKVEISGVEVDDLEDPPREIPFMRDEYIEKEKDALKIGKVEWKKGNKVELWKLIKRWG